MENILEYVSMKGQSGTVGLNWISISSYKVPSLIYHWWAHLGFGTQPGHKASGDLWVEWD